MSESISKFISTLGYAIMAGIVLTIVFVRAGELGGATGGKQASEIISAGSTGLAKVINAATGLSVN